MTLRQKDTPDRSTRPAGGTARADQTEAQPAAGPLGGALRICTAPEHLRRTLAIALVVGAILTLINQADVIIAGDATAGTWVKAALNFVVPFVVSNLGLLAGKREEWRRHR